jgi:hypothetical protein
MAVRLIDDPVFYFTDKRPPPWDPSAYQAQQEAATSQPSEGAAEE